MKALANTLAIIGILVLVYAILGRFVGPATIGLGIVKHSASTGLGVANAILLLAVLAKLSSK
jgi:hypothetical protein